MVKQKIYYPCRWEKTRHSVWILYQMLKTSFPPSLLSYNFPSRLFIKEKITFICHLLISQGLENFCSIMQPLRTYMYLVYFYDPMTLKTISGDITVLILSKFTDKSVSYPISFLLLYHSAASMNLSHLFIYFHKHRSLQKPKTPSHRMTHMYHTPILFSSSSHKNAQLNTRKHF